MNPRTQGFLLLLFGGALLRIGLTDLLLRYVRPVARPWVVLAGIALVVIAIALLVQDFRARRPVVDSADPAPPDHARPAATRIGWLVTLPVVAMVIVAPPALGSYSAAHASSPVDAGAHKEFAALPGTSPHPLSLFDFTTRVVWDAGRTVTGTDVRLTGFVLRPRPDGFVLARLVITCCAADARPVEVFVQTSDRPAPGTWVSVTGRYAGIDPAAPTFPLLTAGSVSAVSEPTNPYD